MIAFKFLRASKKMIIRLLQLKLKPVLRMVAGNFYQGKISPIAIADFFLCVPPSSDCIQSAGCISTGTITNVKQKI